MKRKKLLRELDLRPTTYDPIGSGSDPRPCPSWCYVVQHPDIGHEVDPAHPMAATHVYEHSLESVASLYKGDRTICGSVETAAWVTSLHQVGSSRPTIDVSLRHWPDDEVQFSKFQQRMVLGVEDALELIRVLGHMVEVAES